MGSPSLCAKVPEQESTTPDRCGNSSFAVSWSRQRRLDDCAYDAGVRRSPNTEAELARRLYPPESVLDHITDGSDVIVGVANGAPDTVLDAIEAGADRFHDVRLHQMLPLRNRPYIRGELPGLRHVSWFLSDCDRQAFADGHCDLVPNNFSDVPKLRVGGCACPLSSPRPDAPDLSLGCHADYMAALAGDVPLFLEVNAAMPRTFGENQVHVSQLVGWSEADYPLTEVDQPVASPADRRIAELVAERIPDGATLQGGHQAVPAPCCACSTTASIWASTAS